MSIIKIDEFEMDEDDFRTLLNKYSVSDLIELESILKYIDDKDINLAIKEALNSKINDPKIEDEPKGLINDSIDDKELDILLNLFEISSLYLFVIQIYSFFNENADKKKKYIDTKINDLEKSIRVEIKNRRKKRKKLLKYK
ncbi:MAG: hypothetical protein IIZ40_03475 [Bacilli bacterium]|nr:hypothetical protein [Bacilli bacterium]